MRGLSCCRRALGWVFTACCAWRVGYVVDGYNFIATEHGRQGAKP